jgi:predicted secreted Zn-dependent protease
MKGPILWRNKPGECPSVLEDRFLRYFCYILLITIAISFTSLTRAEPNVLIKYEYYEIAGSTESELRQQMNQNGIRWTNGNTYDALTRWNVNWNYRYDKKEYGCSILSVATTVNVTHKMPKWVNYSDAPSDLQNRWDGYMRALKKHEEGHKNHGAMAAAEIERAVAAMHPSRTCEELGQGANALSHIILEKYVQKEKEYDARTNFGETQGAIFP